jgi:hypothetical protein
VNTLPIRLLLLVEDRILVSWQHLLLTGHLPVPSLDCLCGLPLSCEGCADGIDDLVDGAEALPLAGFLGLRDAPWDFPIQEAMLDLIPL